ncbi:MAG: sensor histidine kinase [Myxococcota bacterium]|nr:sensor histidine kinase [Myxococcota bacterium]
MLLSQLLASRRDELLRRWTDAVRASIDSPGLTRAELADHVPAFVDEIRLALEDHRNLDQSSTAAEHGTQRLRLGFDLNSVVREYGQLRNCILDMALEAGVRPTDVERRVLFDSIITGVAEAVSEYARLRDAELQRHAAEHYAFVAHELRNPLQSARTALYLLQQRGQLPSGAASEALARGLSRIHDLVEHTLELARHGAGVELRREKAQFGRILDEVMAVAAADAEGKGVETDVHREGDDDIEVDVRLLRSAISNVVCNAIKFTPAGKTVHVRGRVAGGRATIEVEDSCGGLATGGIDKAFTPFMQHDATRGGFGLGLAIAKQAIEAHGGTIHVENKPGVGCSFVIDLPVQAH